MWVPNRRQTLSLARETGLNGVKKRFRKKIIKTQTCKRLLRFTSLEWADFSDISALLGRRTQGYHACDLQSQDPKNLRRSSCVVCAVTTKIRKHSVKVRTTCARVLLRVHLPQPKTQNNYPRTDIFSWFLRFRYRLEAFCHIATWFQPHVGYVLVRPSPRTQSRACTIDFKEKARLCRSHRGESGETRFPHCAVSSHLRELYLCIWRRTCCDKPCRVQNRAQLSFREFVPTKYTLRTKELEFVHCYVL